MPQQKFLTVCLAVIVVLLGIATGVAEWGSPAVDTLSYELRRHVIQFLLVGAVGAVVTIIIDDWKRREEDRRQAQAQADRVREYTTELVTSLLRQLEIVYREVKRTRQSLRLVSNAPLSKRQYMDGMWELFRHKRRSNSSGTRSRRSRT